MRRFTKWIICASTATISLAGIGVGVGVHYGILNNRSFDNGELELKPDYNKKNTRDQVIDLLVNGKSEDNSIYKEYFGAYIDLKQFPDGTNFKYISDDINYRNEELTFNFLADKTFGKNNEIIEGYVEYSINIAITLPVIISLPSKIKYDKNLTKYDVLNKLTNDFSSTDEIIIDNLAKYLDLSRFSSWTEFKVIYDKQHFDEQQLEIGIEAIIYTDQTKQKIDRKEAYSFKIDAVMSKNTSVIASGKYGDETKTLEEIKNFLLKYPKKSNEINIKNLSKYLIIDNINENTKFYLDNISLKNGLNGFVNVEISYNNYLDNAGNNVNNTRTFNFMVLTYVSHNATSMFKNRNKVNTRGYQSTLSFLKGDESGDIDNDKTLNKESLSYWFTLRNVPSDAIFTLESYTYAKGSNNNTDKGNVEIQFSIDKYLDDDGNEVIVKKQWKDQEESYNAIDLSSGNEEKNEDYRSICKGTIPIHIENTTAFATEIISDELTVFGLKSSLLYSPADNRMLYSKIRKYLVINDVPSNAKYYFDNITKSQSPDQSRTTTKVAFNMDKWYENAEIKTGKKNLDFTIDVIKSIATNIATKTTYKKSITKESFEENLLKGSPGNRQVNTNSEFFKQYFTLDTSNSPVVTLVDIVDTPHATGGNLKVNFSLNNANDDDGMTINNLKISCNVEYQDLFNFNQTTGTVNGFQSDWIDVTTEVDIPSSLKGVPVTKIASNAFKNNNKITTIKLPITISEIGSYAFSGCSSLRMNKLEIHDNVVTAGTGIFSGIGNVQISDLSVPKHWDDASDGWKFGFSGANYTVRDRKSLELKSKVTTTVHTKNISTDLTETSSSLGEIKNIDRLKQYFTDEIYESYPSDVLFNITNSTNVDKLTQRLSISINKYWDEQGRTKVNKSSDIQFIFDTSALYTMNSTKTEITGLVTGYSTRLEWNGGDIIIPSTVTKIGNNAFNGITSLKTIDVIGVLDNIGVSAFANCVNFTGGFENKLDLSKVTSIGSNAFSGCSNLESTFDLPILTSLGSGAFKGASKLKISNLAFLESFNSIGSSTFEGATSIDAELKLTNVTSIGSNAFNGASNIWTGNEGLILQNTTSIGSDAFNGTYKLNELDEKYIESISVRGIDDEATGVVDLYSNHSLWSQGYWSETEGNIINLDDVGNTISLGSYHSSAIIDGVMYTWGFNNSGQLGDGGLNDKMRPVKVVDNVESGFVNSNVSQISLGYRHSSALVDGVMYTWGLNNYGQLGNGGTSNSLKPIKVSENSGADWTFTNLNVSQISVGSYHSSAVIDGVMYTWGYNFYGQLGIVVTKDQYKPAKVRDNSGTIGSKDWTFTNLNISQISLGFDHTSALVDGVIYTWGYNNYGQLGDGTKTHRSSAVKVHDNSGTTEEKEWTFTNENITQIYSGWSHSSALTGGVVYTWGYNNNGQLGDGTTTLRTRAVKVIDNSGTIDGKEWTFKNSNISRIALGYYHSIVIAGGVMYTWGRNNQGQLGIGNTTRQLKPVKIPNNSGTTDGKDWNFANSGATQISLGEFHSMAMVKGVIYTWGYNSNGQLGDTTTDNKNQPVKIAEPTKITLNVSEQQQINMTSSILKDQNNKKYSKK
ncbi:MAG: leucine-rich repeat protein [Mycoplasma sp.]